MATGVDGDAVGSELVGVAGKVHRRGSVGKISDGQDAGGGAEALLIAVAEKTVEAGMRKAAISNRQEKAGPDSEARWTLTSPLPSIHRNLRYPGRCLSRPSLEPPSSRSTACPLCPLPRRNRLLSFVVFPPRHLGK